MAPIQTVSHWSNDSLVLAASSSGTSTLLLNLSEPPSITSLSIDSLAEPKPQFPSGHIPPIFTLIESRERLRSATKKAGYPGPGSRRKERAVVTAPTIPRMRVILEEKILVDRWTAEVRPWTPPCHTPWGDGGRMSPVAGSLERQSIPKGFHSAHASQEQKSQIPRLLQRFPPRQNTKSSTHKPFVGVNETLTSATDDKSSALDNPGEPVHVATPTTRTIQQEQFPASPAEAKQERRKRPYFRHTGNQASRKRINLAVRRGHMAFPPLKLDQVATSKRKGVAPYDSIPTAFRGSPAAHSPTFDQTKESEPQNLPLKEMLENLREKCAPFSSRASLPIGWLYQPLSCSKNIAELPISGPNHEEHKWDIASPLMDKTNALSSRSSNSHPAPRKDDNRHTTNNPKSPCDEYNLCVPLKVEEADDLPQRRPLPLRPSLVSPSSRCSSPRVRKTVRFADPPSQAEGILVDNPVSCPSPVSPAANVSDYQKRPDTARLPMAPSSAPISSVRPPQLARPGRNSWNRVLRVCAPISLPPPQRPFSHRFPTSPKLTFCTLNGSSIVQPLMHPPLQLPCTYKQPLLDMVGKSPAAFPSPRSFGKRSLMGKARKTYISREHLKISNPIPITAVPRPKRGENDARRENGEIDDSTRNHVSAPLRSIFTKFK